MRPAARLGPDAAEDHAVFHGHGADRGIGPGAAEAAAAERKRKLHEAVIEPRIGVRGCPGVAHFRAATGGLAPEGLVGSGLGSSSPLNSANACSKSFGSRKLR